MAEAPFSRRHGYSGQAQEITIREDAPEGVRFFVVSQVARLGLKPYPFRDITCSVLETRPDPSNWSEYPNVWDEAEGHVYSCEWFQFYDMVEAIWDYFKKQDDASYDDPKAPEFEKELNDFFVRKGIGWKLENGQILVRGQEAFEANVKSASAILKNTGRPTAGNHMHEALVALSRRPTPDFSGAMYHAMGCLECVARDVTGQPKDTLGKIMKDHPDLVPAPLDEVVGKIWGYASNQARHVVEGREPELAEAELLVGLSASVSMYLSKKLGLNK